MPADAHVAGLAGQDDRARQPERVVVDLGLRQVERVGALDGARGDVVGDQVADDLAAASSTSASSGSGTSQPESARIRSGAPGGGTRYAGALRNSSGRSAS